MNNFEDFKDLLAKTEEYIRWVEKEAYGYSLAEGMLDKFFDIGMALYHHPEWKETQEFKRFYEATRSDMTWVSHSQLSRYASDYLYEKTATDWADPMISNGDGNSLFYRSALEFYKDIYQDIMPPELEEYIEDVTEAFRKKQDEGIDIYTEDERLDMPPSHWWFRYKRPEGV